METDQPSLSTEESIKRIRLYIERMPSLSTTVTKVMEICNKPDPSPNDLIRVVSLDPVLTGQVLQLINSAYYALPNKIVSLTRAIIMLGINTVKNMAINTAIMAMVMQEEPSHYLPIDTFWTHSICVGVTAKAIAAIKGIPAAQHDEFFVAGLLHDLGKVPLTNCFPSEYKHVLAQAEKEQKALHKQEMDLFGFDHGRVGKSIAEKWQLSDTITEALCYHHNPTDPGVSNHDLVEIVALADLYANLYEIGFAGNLFPDENEIIALLKLVGVTWHELAAQAQTVEEEIKKAKIFLEISLKDRS
jgi:HD-like signal output (HDOD) protein